ncbi:hypothetical protein Agabi119p4_9632 [Agaricus bisporus var. burnettii]|uniref:FAD-binding FR-type domain-containing protein n=1 Tax=Agaricus bisporus var. burnettii TaxID=192524 RepID=A0A8H7C452_AGABI|nr:hypothetical protein Agabi119p4_9632 [Agaricus bisporus var. burnettii]
MADTGTPPVIPAEFKQYDSYAEAPAWQLKFSVVWVAAVGIFILFSLPRLIRGIRSRRAMHDFFGVTEDVDKYMTLFDRDFYDDDAKSNNVSMRQIPRRDWRKNWLSKVLNLAGATFLWTVPRLELNIGQIFVITGYLITVILCMVIEAPLLENSNRAGFIVLAQFPVVFLFATKNSILSLLLGPGYGYERLNYVHRWCGRGMLIAAAVHGALWIKNHLTWGFPIIGQQKETSGVASLGLLCAITITSVKSVRRAYYDYFYILHLFSFVAFFVTVCYHSIYAPPWIFPPLAFLGLDLLLRFLRFRIKDATLTPLAKQLTMINIPYCTDGWTAGQHVRIRVFFGGRIFESHPLTIMTAPPSISCVSDVYTPGITLGARVTGDWTRALNKYAQEKRCLDSKASSTQVQVMLDGPYGGCSLDLGRYETVLLFAGGSGVTFTLGMLDDIVGRCVRLGRPNGERTRRIEFAWCVKSFGTIEWFAPALMELAAKTASSDGSSTPLSLHISVYVTCLCDPEAVPPIPNCDVTILRPHVHHILSDLINPPFSQLPLAKFPSPKSPKKTLTSINQHEIPTLPSLTSSASNDDQDSVLVTEPDHVMTTREGDDIEFTGGLDPHISRKLPWLGDGGGVGVCASGPTSLVREAANAVAQMKLSKRGLEMGGIDIHVEPYAL